MEYGARGAASHDPHEGHSEGYPLIELLGVGIPRPDGGWLLHRVCARLGHGQLTVVVSGVPEERLALLDAAAGVVIPVEGRVWVSGLPLMRETRNQVRSRVVEANLHTNVAERRSLFWNTLVTGPPGLGTLQGLLRLPRKDERRAAARALARVELDGRAHEPVATLDGEGRARLGMARALARRPEWLVIREADAGLGVTGAERFLALLRRVVLAERVSVLASVASLSLARAYADRIIVLAEGLLIFDGPPQHRLARAEARLGALVSEDAESQDWCGLVHMSPPEIPTDIHGNGKFMES